jgi:hypothetical protein
MLCGYLTSPLVLRDHVCGEYLANEHVYELFHGEYVYEYGVRELTVYADARDVHLYDYVNECV